MSLSLNSQLNPCLEIPSGKLGLRGRRVDSRCHVSDFGWTLNSLCVSDEMQLQKKSCLFRHVKRKLSLIVKF